MNKKILNIALIEPFLTGSHEKWANTFQIYSRHQIDIFGLPGKHWKWRMHNGAVSLAKKFLESPVEYDLVLVTDMLDLTTFLALTRSQTAHLKSAIYFHENQLTYPWSPTDMDVKLKRDNHYAFINYTSALCADRIFFNSDYHKQSFIGALPNFLNQFPDHREFHCIQLIQNKSQVLPLLLDLPNLSKKVKRPDSPCIFLWNHRWEYDKNPEQFFKLMYHLKMTGHKFQLIVLGERFGEAPPSFNEAREKLTSEIIHCGFADTLTEYYNLVQQADVMPVTSNQEFFGGSVVEAIYLNVMPLLPNRLAYPEHISDQLHTQFIYEDEEGLFEKAASAIENIGIVRNGHYASLVEKYLPSNLIIQYDDALSQLVTDDT